MLTTNEPHAVFNLMGVQFKSTHSDEASLMIGTYIGFLTSIAVSKPGEMKKIKVLDGDSSSLV